MECITKEHPKDCDEVAVELFEPMKMETQQSFEDIECLSSPQFEQEIQPTTSASIDQQPVEHEVEIEKPKEQVQEVKPVLDTLKTPSINRPLSTSSNIDLSNSLISFGNVETICSVDNQTDIWSTIRTRICSRKADLLPHANCFLDTALKEKKCASRVSPYLRHPFI